MKTRINYNPKAHAPAVYIPCWLIQVPADKLSYPAKILYGRLAQWSSAKGTVHRSVNQLSQEIGMPAKSVERILKELRDVGLIGTYRVTEGGVNHYQFFEHVWMNEPINENLEYKSSSNSNETPPLKSEGTPPSNLRVPPLKNEGSKIKEIKVNKKRAIATPVDNSKPRSERPSQTKRASRSSVNLQPISPNFFPDEEAMTKLNETSVKVHMPTHELLEKFIRVSQRYKARSADWNKTFIQFLEREMPKRVFENKNGKISRYDNKSLY